MLKNIIFANILIVDVSNHACAEAIFENNKCYVPEYACPLISNIYKYKKINPELIRVLSIDGGGIRGIIPARIL